MHDQLDVVPHGLSKTGSLSPVLIRTQLERVLQSASFSKAPSLSRLLRHLVEWAIAGNGQASKEYAIGVEVFDRGDAFDPRIDNIVRVQARRLRARLEEYYALEGRADPLIIEVPKGQYVAEFRPSSHCDSAARNHVPAGSAVASCVGEASAPTRSVRHISLPAPRAALVGREKELASLKQLLLSGRTRLVTLSGAGGTGKTRLAVEVASDLTSQLSGGVWFVPLASISDPSVVVPTVAETLGLRHVVGQPLAVALREYVHLTIRSPALLVIDNVEHLLQSAPLFGELLDASESLKILVTSRAALHLYAEHEFSLAPLPTPNVTMLPPVAELRRNPAVELFVQRALAVKPAFELNLDNYRGVAEICLRVDGLPLAIELAAARVRTLSLPSIVKLLQHRLALLTDGPRDVDARHQTLRSAIDWSYDLLTAFEQKLFRRVAVFSGGCTLESAEAVCNAHRDLELDAPTGISSLADKSLLYQRDGASGEPRFFMLESVREYALERLRDSGEEMSTRQAHAAYALVVGEERNNSYPDGASGWIELCDTEQDNLRAALDWLIANERGEWAMRLGLALYHFWEAREHLLEGRDRLRAILNMKSTAAPTKSRAHVAFCAAAFMAAQCDYDGALALFDEARCVYSQLDDRKGVAAMLTALGTNRRLSGDLDAGRTWLERALHTYRELQDRPGIAGALSNLGDLATAQGDCATARSLLEEALALFAELGDSGGRGWSLNHLGDVALRQNQVADARRSYTEGLEIFCCIGDRWGIARSCADLGYVALQERQYEVARSFFVQSLDTLRDLGHTRGMVRAFEGLACLAMDQGLYSRALTLAGAVARLRQTLGAAARRDEEAAFQLKLSPAWKHSDAALARNAWMNGSEMPLEHAIRYALEPQPS